jgi:hypothetical protein
MKVSFLKEMRVFSQPDVLALGEEADFEALNCLPALNFIRSTKLHLSTEPAFLPNACACCTTPSNITKRKH